MSKIDDGGPAFPHTIKNDDGSHFFTSGGMTLRDWFAGQALAGLTAHPQCGPIGEGTEDTRERTGVLALEAYYAADAMLAARKESK